MKEMTEQYEWCRGACMDWSAYIKQWSRAPVKLWDCRRVIVEPYERAIPYRFPVNAFLFAHRGDAQIRINGASQCEGGKFLLLHGEKGSLLEVSTQSDTFDYYIVLYKHIKRSHSAAGSSFNFPLEAGGYVVEPSEPLPLVTLLERLHEQWSRGGELARIQATGLFYQFVFEQFSQIQLIAEAAEPPGLADQVARYIQEHIREAISLETMASQFHYSTRYLTRVFKRKFGCSPTDYTIHKRIELAKTLLDTTDASIREAAANVGYSDMYYFSKLFKKQTGVTPRQYKLRPSSGRGSISPIKKSDTFIAVGRHYQYSVDNENCSQNQTWRVHSMNGRMKPAWTLSLLLALTMLLAACGGNGAAAPSNALAEEQPSATEEQNQEGAMRAYTDALGREVEVPVNPQKVVVFTYGGYLLPLGMKPIGVDKPVMELYGEDMAGVADVGEGKGNVEAVAALQPDLIIFPDYLGAETAASYEAIAPTVAVAWGGDPDVIKTLETMGDLLNRKEQADAWIKKFEEKLSMIREQLSLKFEPNSTAISFILYNNEILVGGETGTLADLIYKDFGFELPAHYKQFANGGGVLSLEDLAANPADYFFTQMTDKEMDGLWELFESPIYQTIPAVKEKRIFNVSREKWNYGPYLVEQGVDELIKQVSELK